MDVEGFDDGVNGPSLFAFGYFVLGGASAFLNGAARWDGTQWRPLGAGVSTGPLGGATVTNAAVFSRPGAPSELCIAGDFATVGGAPALYAAAWAACVGPGAGFCAGDGADPLVQASCPCGNRGAVGHGCANSVNAVGASLDATGRPATDDVVFEARFLPATAPCLFLKSNTRIPGGFQGGDGVLCLGGSAVRLGLQSTAGGQSSYPMPGQPSLSARRRTPPGSGVVAYYQAIYRNAAAAFCPPETINVTNGYVIAW
ncbi:MAG: hypothetical protein IPJ77_21425 [Planctomycetes bacterium]|nr:hypothetical protein [Planctomycetota bacterium]